MTKANAIAQKITKNIKGDIDNEETVDGTVLKYDPDTGKLDTVGGDRELGRPLVPIADWSQDSVARNYNSGFAEGAADSLFASLVSENSSFEDLNQDALFNSPFHFIGMGRGAVVNSEIIQRLGTYYPKPAEPDNPEDPNYDNRNLFPDLQMTTIDPNDFDRSSLSRLPFNNYYDPTIHVWNNVTYADNYYQTASSANPRGRHLINLIPEDLLPPDTDNFLNEPDLSLNLGGYFDPDGGGSNELYEFSRVGFTPDTFEQSANGENPHNRTNAWYGGTANVSWNKDNNPFDATIHRRKGDFSYSELDPYPDYLNPWYTPTHTDFQIGDEDAQWEGIGTGWYYSPQGGGYNRRALTLNSPQSVSLSNNSTRTPLEYDNTHTDEFVKGKMRGDFAVPTLFNGNFDAIYAINDINRPIPGWSLHGGGTGNTNSSVPLINSSVKRLVKWDKIDSLKKPINNGNDEQRQRPSYLDTIGYDINQPNYALELKPNESITHNRFVVPEWGGVRLNLHVPEPAVAEDQTSLVRVVLIDEDGERYELKSTKLTEWNPNPREFENERVLFPAPSTELGTDDNRKNNDDLPAIDLREVSYLKADKTQVSESQTNRIGFGSVGFETFQVDIPKDAEQKLRGKIATLEISVEGNKKVFLDDIFFQSEHLLSGNPSFKDQIATRDESNPANYVIEMPQFSISYNENKGSANWVSYRLDRSWMNSPGLGKRNFVEDFSLPPETFDRNRNNVLKGSTTYTQGHIASAAHRGRSVQSFYNDNKNNKYSIRKDHNLTHLMSNLLPEVKVEEDIDPWEQLETYLTDKLVGRFNPNRSAFEGAGKELYIISGGSGEKQRLVNPEKRFGQLPNFVSYNEEIVVPEDLWKVILVLEPGQDLTDVTKDTVAFAIKIPNDLSRAGDNWRNSIISVKKLEQQLNSVEGNPKYDFFSNIPKDIREAIKDNDSIGTLPASLLANDNDSPELLGEVFSIASSNLRTRKESPIGEDSLPQKHIGEIVSVRSERGTNHIGSAQIGKGEISSSQISPSQISSSQISIPQIGSKQTSHDEIDVSQIGSSEIGIIQISSEKSSTNQASFGEIDTVQRGINIAKIDSHQVSSPHTLLSGNSIIQIAETQSGGIEGTSISPITHLNSPKNTNVLNNTATNIWSDLLQTETQLDIDFQITDLLSGQLAEATITGFNSSGKPNTGTIFIDHDANGAGWFIDETPLDNSEFTAQDTDSYLLAAAESEASGKYDLLTTVLHELAHLYGFIDGYQGFDANVKTEDGTTKFIGDGFEAVLDGEHLDKSAHPYDLLNTHLAPGIRKLPSELDVEILQALIATELDRNGNKAMGEELLAFLISDPLLAIGNGDFSITDTTTDSFAWDTRGASSIEDGQAVLTEDSPFLSNFTQTFTVPEDAKTVQFKLIGAELGASELVPLDAFEVALIDANTNQPLISNTGLTQTDSLLNIQNDGTAYFSDKVRISGATSGEIIGLDKPRTVTVDISDLTPGSEATLYFNLLGFGAADSRVAIDDVRLSDQFLLPPVANDDTATVIQGETKAIEVLANDTDKDGTIATDSIQIASQPANGTVTVNDDGTVSYAPNEKFVGEDSFTYTVADNDEQQSETATVEIVVENAIPEISEVQIPENITEGDEIVLSAVATDAGNDTITYIQDFGDGSNTFVPNYPAGSDINSETQIHTYVDNGIYDCDSNNAAFACNLDQKKASV